MNELQTSVVYCGDNLEWQKKLPDRSIDLIYADPPFFSNRHYEIIWNDGAEIRAFEDRWKGGLNQYLKWMRDRLVECHRVLKDTGSMYLHCDWHANSYLRIVMDKLFGYRNFHNEIIWCYKGGNATNQFRRKHDTVLLYTKTRNFIFNSKSIRIPYSSKLLSIAETDGNGKLYYRTGQTDKGKVFLHPAGQLPYDWWDDIPSATMSHGKERIGYPTQKPEALLKRIIKASSNEGDTVLDPFCGCGTTIAVAQQLGRRWIGIDVSPTACRMMKERLNKLGVVAELIGMPATTEHLKAMKPFEFQEWIVNRITGIHANKKSNDMGIDGYDFARKPIQVKQTENVGRNVIDNFETAIRRAGYTEGTIYAFSFGKGAHEEVARVGLEDNLIIKLVEVSTLESKC